jgi:hypothetical protein
MNDKEQMLETKKIPLQKLQRDLYFESTDFIVGR